MYIVRKFAYFEVITETEKELLYVRINVFSRDFAVLDC